MSNDANKQAFPTSRTPYAGLTLRDYFAAKAMNGIIAQAGGTAVSSIEDDPMRAANLAYMMADAMLEARK